MYFVLMILSPRLSLFMPIAEPIAKCIKKNLSLNARKFVAPHHVSSSYNLYEYVIQIGFDR